MDSISSPSGRGLLCIYLKIRSICVVLLIDSIHLSVLPDASASAAAAPSAVAQAAAPPPLPWHTVPLAPDASNENNSVQYMSWSAARCSAGRRTRPGLSRRQRQQLSRGYCRAYSERLSAACRRDLLRRSDIHCVIHTHDTASVMIAQY